MFFCDFLQAFVNLFSQLPLIGGFYAWVYTTIRNFPLLGCP
jgi:hypothetical protein